MQALARGVRAWRDASPRIGVVGATGAVGTRDAAAAARARLRRRARCSRRRALPASSSAGIDRRGGDPGGARGRRPRRLPLLRRHLGLRELVPHAVRGGAVCVDKSAAFRLDRRASRSSSRRSTAAARSSTTASSRTRTAARSRSPACSSRCTRRPACARPRRDLPVGLRRRRAGDGAAARRAAGRARPADGLGLRRRGVRRGVEAARRDAEDHGAARRCRSARPASACRDGRPRRGGLDRDGGAALAPSRRAAILGAAPSVADRGVPDARARPPAATRCSSAASASDPSTRERPRALPRVRQPAQGRGAERDPDRELLLERASRRSRAQARFRARERAITPAGCCRPSKPPSPWIPVAQRICSSVTPRPARRGAAPGWASASRPGRPRPRRRAAGRRARSG